MEAKVLHDFWDNYQLTEGMILEKKDYYYTNGDLHIDTEFVEKNPKIFELSDIEPPTEYDYIIHITNKFNKETAEKREQLINNDMAHTVTLKQLNDISCTIAFIKKGNDIKQLMYSFKGFYGVLYNENLICKTKRKRKAIREYNKINL